MGELSVLTFNTLLRGDVRARLRLLGEALETADYDVACLQEVFWPWNLPLLRRAAVSYRHVAHGTPLPVVAGGLVTLSRLPITGGRFIPFGPIPPPRRAWLMRKGMLVTGLRVAGHRLALVNTHLTANMADDWSAPYNAYVRVEEAELRRVAATVARIDPAVPVLVMGDFNVPRDSPVFHDFLAEAGLVDALAGETEPTYRPTERWPEPPPIDHVLLRPSTECSVEARLTLRDPVTLPDGRVTYLSDHYAIEARLSFGAPG
jgi:endonuclease/exonuclease/phosphatase family metal-dependent hydrolase